MDGVSGLRLQEDGRTFDIHVKGVVRTIYMAFHCPDGRPRDAAMVDSTCPEAATRTTAPSQLFRTTTYSSLALQHVLVCTDDPVAGTMSRQEAAALLGQAERIRCVFYAPCASCNWFAR